MKKSNFLKSLIISFTSGAFLLPSQVNASQWNDTVCVLGNSNRAEYCIETKGDAILNGKQGFLHTYTFPNGRKFYFFYGEESPLCDWKNTYVREKTKNYWLKINVSCTDDNYIDFSLPSGSRLFKIYQSS